MRCIGVETPARDDAMDVRMKQKILAPGVQDRREADLGTEVLGILRDFLERLGCCGEEDVEHDVFVTEGDRVQRVGDREGDMPVRDGKEMGESFLEPLCLLEPLALRAVPVPARVVRVAEDLAAIGAGVNVPAKGGGTTLLDVSHDRELGRGGRMPAAILLAVRTQDVRDLETRP